jgi:hypothetical protein
MVVVGIQCVDTLQHDSLSREIEEREETTVVLTMGGMGRRGASVGRTVRLSGGGAWSLEVTEAVIHARREGGSGDDRFRRRPGGSWAPFIGAEAGERRRCSKVQLPTMKAFKAIVSALKGEVMRCESQAVDASHHGKEGGERPGGVGRGATARGQEATSGGAVVRAVPGGGRWVRVGLLGPKG